MSSEDVCQYNRFVLCYGGWCERCGWNPANEAKRRKTAKKKIAFELKKRENFEKAMQEQLRRILRKCQKENDRASEDAMLWALRRCRSRGKN